MSNSTCVVLSCQDSTLSKAGNIIGILTFAAAVFVGLIIRAKLIANSAAEVSVIIEGNNTAMRQLRKYATRLNELANSSSSPSPLFRDDLDDLYNVIEIALTHVKQIDDRMKKLRDYERRGIWRAARIFFEGVVNIAELTGTVKKVQSLLGEVQIGMMQL